jgi:glutathione peroxidase
MDNIGDFTVNTLKGERCALRDFAGDVVLIVNVASQCGFTPQYKGLEKMYQTYKNAGFQVLAFPCNQFGQQEPGSAAEIQTFCEVNYHITFPLFEKIAVNGPSTHPLYRYLKKAAPGLLGTGRIKWNFTKFLINRKGQVVKRFAPMRPVEAIIPWIEALLKEEK